MVLIILVIFGIIFYFPLTRCAAFNIVPVIRYAAIDLYHYFRYRTFDYMNMGQLVCYFAHFGGGKTLSATAYITNQYHRFNNKYIYDPKQKKLILQKVHILSNVDFVGIPSTKLESLSQIVDCANHNNEIDQELGTRTCTLVLIDEASSQMNSRNFSKNINPDFLSALVTCRHYNLSILYTSQKFNLTDKLLRDVTQTCIRCSKIWRFMLQYVYSADSLEYASDPTLVKPLGVRCWFIHDKYFNQYDTYAFVDKLNKSFESGDLRSSQEILELRGQVYADNDLIAKPSRKLKTIRSRKKK